MRERHETGVDEASGKELVKVDPRYFRPTEVDVLIGDASKARAKLGWKHRVSFDALVSEMVEEDRKALRGVTQEWKRDELKSMTPPLLFDLRGKRVYVAGHAGLAGSAIVRRLAVGRLRDSNRGPRELDLTKQEATEKWIMRARPDAIFLVAASCRRHLRQRCISG